MIPVCYSAMSCSFTHVTSTMSCKAHHLNGAYVSMGQHQSIIITRHCFFIGNWVCSLPDASSVRLSTCIFPFFPFYFVSLMFSYWKHFCRPEVMRVRMSHVIVVAEHWCKYIVTLQALLHLLLGQSLEVSWGWSHWLELQWPHGSSLKVISFKL